MLYSYFISVSFQGLSHAEVYCWKINLWLLRFEMWQVPDVSCYASWISFQNCFAKFNYPNLKYFRIEKYIVLMLELKLAMGHIWSNLCFRAKEVEDKCLVQVSIAGQYPQWVLFSIKVSFHGHTAGL